jgi:CBS domain-containing protein
MLLNSYCMLDVACCSPRTTALEAAHLMRKKHTEDLVVIDDELKPAPLGIITDRDIVVEVLGKGLDPAVTTVGSVICTRVVVADGAEDSTQVLERMRTHGERRIPATKPSRPPQADRSIVTNSRSSDATSMPHDATPNHPACLGWREPMIRRAAYLRSLDRPACPGKELEDWLVAEREIDNLIACGAAPYR